MSVAGSPRQPAEVQNARNVLGLERRQGCQDRAVVGGLATYLANWRARAAGAGDRALSALAEQVVAALDGYAELPAPERSARLDRALGMLEASPEPAGLGASPSSPNPLTLPSPSRGEGNNCPSGFSALPL